MAGETIWQVPDQVAQDVSVRSWRSALMARMAGLPAETLTALNVDTEHVVTCIGSRLDHVVGRPLTGLVLGAVQSGKTASMLAVSALAVDNQFNIIVLVSGTRVALWRQTLERALRDLDGWSTECAFARRQARVWLPDPESQAEGAAPDSMFGVSVKRIVRYVKGNKPIVAVVMKQADHLNALRKTLHDAIGVLDQPLRMLVIDDEADDGSILSVPFQGSHDDRFLPKWIEGLWAKGPTQQQLVHDKLQVAYLAYTATPQANLLQHDQNPLSPRDFITCIRSPGAQGAPDRRDGPSYSVPALADRNIGGSHIYPPAEGLFHPCI